MNKLALVLSLVLPRDCDFICCTYYVIMLFPYKVAPKSHDGIKYIFQCALQRSL